MVGLGCVAHNLHSGRRGYRYVSPLTLFTPTISLVLVRPAGQDIQLGFLLFLMDLLGRSLIIIHSFILSPWRYFLNLNVSLAFVLLLNLLCLGVLAATQHQPAPLWTEEHQKQDAILTIVQVKAHSIDTIKDK